MFWCPLVHDIMLVLTQTLKCLCLQTVVETNWVKAYINQEYLSSQGKIFCKYLDLVNHFLPASYKLQAYKNENMFQSSKDLKLISQEGLMLRLRIKY